MADDDVIEPGAVLRRFGFDAKGKPDKAAPSASRVDSTGSDIVPGSVLQRFGFDADGKSTSTTATPPPPAKPPAYDIEGRAERLARASGSTASVVEGMPIVGPIAQRGVAAAQAALDPLLGRGRDVPYGERYGANLDILRRADELYRAQHPVAAVAGNLAGAGVLTAPVSATTVGGRLLGAVGETLGARAYQGAAGGALIGGVDAELRGENPVAGGGAPMGAAAGFLGPVLGAGAGAAYRAVANATRGGEGVLSGLNSIAREWLANATANETDASIDAAARRMGHQGFVADLNPNLTELAAGVANRAEPPASARIGEAYRDRQVNARQVTEEALNNTIGPKLNIEHFKDAITEERAKVSDPLYEQFRSTRVPPTPELDALMPQLEAAGAISAANKKMAMQGLPATEQFGGGTRTIVKGPGYHIGEDIEPRSNLTAEAWDYAKRALDDQIEVASRRGYNDDVRILTGLKNRLTQAIDNHPDPTVAGVWRQAREAFAGQSELLNQMQAGRDTFLGPRSGTSPDQLAEELRGLSRPELTARLVGLRQAADEVMGATRNGDTTLRNKLLAPHNQEKLRMLLGNDRAEELIATIERQHYLAGQAQYVNPRAGSPTAPRTQAAARLEAPPLEPWNPSLTQPLSWLPPSLTHEFLPSTILQGGRNAAYASARQQLAPVLTSKKVSAFWRSIQAENAARAKVAQRSQGIRDFVTSLATGPLSEAVRLEAERNKGAMSGIFSGRAY